MEILSLIHQIFQLLIDIFPRFAIICLTERGVKLKYGGFHKEVTHQNGMWVPNFTPFSLPNFKKLFTVDYWFKRTGIHWYWPFVSEIQSAHIKEHTINLYQQRVDSKDGRSIYFGGIVVVEVEDVVKLLLETYDYEDTTRDRAVTCLTRTILDHTYDELVGNFSSIREELEKKLRKELKKYGIRVKSADFSDFCGGIPVIHLGND